jgi:hypothetical protein
MDIGACAATGAGGAAGADGLVIGVTLGGAA